MYVLLPRSGSNGEVLGVGTVKNNLYGKAIIVAAGCWSGSLTRDLFRESEIVLDVPVRPRKVITLSVYRCLFNSVN